MKFLVLLLGIILSINVHAGSFGGSRSGGSFSSGRSSSSFSSGRSSFSSGSRSSGGSYFGGSRSSPSPTISKPAPSVSKPSPSYSSPSSPRTVIHETHNYGGGGGFGGGGNGFFSGFLLGGLMNNHPAPTVVVAGQGAGPEQAAPVIASPQSEGHGFFYYVFQGITWIIFLFGLVAGTYLIYKWATKGSILWP